MIVKIKPFWICLLGILCVGCLEDTIDPISRGERAERKQRAELKEYDELTATLEDQREILLDAYALNMVGPVQVRGSMLFWLKSEGAWESMHSVNMDTGARTDYTFAVNSGGFDHPYAVSQSHIVTVEPVGGKIIYHVYAVGDSKRKVGSFTMDAPTNAKWFAFGVDGETVYVVEDVPPEGPDVPGVTRLLAWTVTEQTLQEVVTFEALGIRSGVVDMIDVNQGLLMFVESGRLWRIDLDQLLASWVQSDKQVGQVFYDHRGIVYSNASAVLFYRDTQANETRNLSEEIVQTGWQLNDSFTMISDYAGGGFTRVGDLIVYVSISQSVMTYHLETRQLRPLLLDPRSYGPEDDPLTFAYTSPQVLKDRILIVHGSTGLGKRTKQERWVYRVDLGAMCTRSCF